jgi:hypothetical protein
MAIPIPVTKTLIATVPWGIPITNEVNRLGPLVDGRTPTAWVNLTLTNGWTNAGGASQPVGVAKGSNALWLRGGMNAGTVGLPFATLPAGYRPVGTFTFLNYSYTSIGVSICAITINASSGTLQVDAVTNMGTVSFVGLYLVSPLF